MPAASGTNNSCPTDNMCSWPTPTSKTRATPLIEENPEEKISSVRKTYAPVAFGSKMFSPSQIKMSIYAKEFLAIYFAFMEYSHILWESTKPVVVLTDNKSVTRFFQTKIIPPALWNACNFVLQFHFTIAHVPGKMNTAADFLSLLDLHPNTAHKPTE